MNQRMSSDRESPDTVDFWWHSEELKILQRQRPEVGEVLDNRNAGREQGAVDRTRSSARVIDIQRVDPNQARPLVS